MLLEVVEVLRVVDMFEVVEVVEVYVCVAIILLCRRLADVPGSLLEVPVPVTDPASQLSPVSGVPGEPD